MRKRTTHQKENQGEPIQVPDRGSLVGEYEKFKKRYGHLEESTLAKYKWYLDKFFDWLGLDKSPELLGKLDFQLVQKFVLSYGKTHGWGNQQQMHSSLRSFLTFCHIVGHLPINLSRSIPSARKRKLASVPFVLDAESVDKLFEGIDRTCLAGKRDYAILKMLATYGIRGIQVRRLKLEDLFWRQGKILFQPSKGGTAVEQPLVGEVSDALLDYLLNARPKTGGYREVFLTNLPPFRPIAHSCTLTTMVARRLSRANIKVPSNGRKGSHLFRHMFASRLLDSGTPLTHIGEMLGHRNPNSTLIYTKIDFKNLIEVAQEWPEVRP